MMSNQSGDPKEKLRNLMLHNRWMKVVSVLASIVVFCTVYALILPAITMSIQEPKCGIEEHTHTEECYDAEGNLICGMTEHVHSAECYSDLYADIEDENYWSAEMPELTGDRNTDVINVAASQLGYRESENNYLVLENDQIQGYTRYGQWYGDAVDGSAERLENGLSTYAYSDWNALFASFVLDHAGIYDMGLDSNAGNWVSALSDAGIYRDASEYVPQAGDLVFFAPVTGADMEVGIVSNVNMDASGENPESVSVILGDSNGSVEEIQVANAESVYGYGVLTPAEEVAIDSPEEPEEAEEYPEDESTAAEENADPEAVDELPGETTDISDEAEEEIADEMTEEAVDEQAEESVEDTSVSEEAPDEIVTADPAEIEPEEPAETEPEEPAETEPEEPAETETEKPAETETEEPAEIKTLTVKQNDYIVTMSYGADAEIPEGSKLYVREIVKGSEKYDEYIEKARATLGLEGKDAAELLGRFFDIKIMTKEGEYEPKAAVNVNIEYKKAIETEDTSCVSAVHFTDEGAEEIAEEIAVDTVDISDSGDDMAMVKSVEFSAESFSVYGVVYTVDFTYDGKTWSMPGRGSYNLNEVLQIIGINVPDEGVKDILLTLVKGDDIEGALYLTEEQNEWYINSDNPFNSTYELSFTIGENHYRVTVTDAAQTTDLSNLLTNFQVAGAESNGDGTYTVKPGKTYSIDLSFAESETTYQFSNTDEMRYVLPAGLDLRTINSPFSITVNYLGNNITINGNTASIIKDGDKSIICIKFNSADPNYSKLEAITTTQIKIHTTGVFDKNYSGSDIVIPGGGTYHIDGNPDVSIQKSGKITDFDNGKVEYTLALTSNGSNNGVTVTDTLEGGALSGYDQTKGVKLYKNGVEVTGTSVTYNNGGKGFSLNTGALEDGQYEIKYTVNLNKSALTLDGNAVGTADDTKNTIEYLDKTTSHNLGHVVEKHNSWKGAGSSTTGEDGMAITPWTITAYSTPLIQDGQLRIVHDEIKTSGTTYYKDEPIKVKITDVTTGNIIAEEITIPWSNANSTDTTWSYDMSQLPGYSNTGKYWRYNITYKTETDMSSAVQSKEIVNEGGPKDDEHEGKGTVSPPEGNRTGIEKSVVSVNENNEVTWRIKLTIPALGVDSDRSYVTEHLPSSGKYKDTYVEDSFSYVDGYAATEGTPDVTIEENGDVTFRWPNGFAASSDKRTVIFTFKTKYNSEWIANENASKVHQNHAEFNGGHSYASTTYASPLFEKVGSQYIQEDGEIYFDFDVKTNKITDGSFGTDGTGTIVFSDQYDSHLEYVTGSAKLYGGDSDGNINTTNNSAVPETAVVQDENKITFTVTKNMLPTKYGQLADGSWGDTGELCTYYRLRYRMKVKNSDALISEALQLETLTVKMNNSITSDIGTSNTTVEYTPNILDKWQSANLDADQENHKGKVQFTIHLNEAQVDLVDGDVITLYDKLENISTAYQDIEITFPKGNYVKGQTKTTIEETGQEVDIPYFNMQGDTITFYLPDGVDTLITYWAKPTGEVSADGKIHYTNTAKLKGYEKKVEESAEWSGEASGLSTQYGVHLYKAEGYVNSNLLAGAEFKIFIVDEEDEDGNIVSGTPLKDKTGKDKIFVTDDDGTVNVEGSDTVDGWNLKPEQRYYLLEVKAPEGFAIDTTKYSFIISAKGYTNYTRNSIVAPDGSGAIVKPWTYYNGDVLTVKDWPKEGELEITKNFDPNGDITSYEQLNEDQKSAIKFEVYVKQEDDSWKLYKTIGFDQFTLDETGIPKFKVGDLAAGTYKVIEIDEDETCIEQTYSVQLEQDSVVDEESDYVTINITEDDIKNHNLHSMSVTNKYESKSEFKIHKYADRGIEGKVDIRLAGAEFGVFTVESNTPTATKVGDKNYKTNGRGVFSVRPGSYGIEYDTLYALKEVKAPDGFKLSSDVYYFYFVGPNSSAPDSSTLPQGTVIIINYKEIKDQYVPNEIGTTSVGVKKIWQNDKLEEDTTKANEPIQVKVNQVATLDKEGKNISSTEYYWDDTVTFTATKNGSRWDLSTEAALPEGVSIVDGRLTGIPTMMITKNGIPLYYHYTIEEVVPSGYTASYSTDTEEDGGTTITVTNRPSSVQSFVKLKAEKKWVDASGNDITSDMGVENGVTVDVCRKEGVVRDGTIIEANGDKKSAGNLFPLLIRLGNGNQGTTTFETTSVIALPDDEIQIVFKLQNKNEISLSDFNVEVGFMDQHGNMNGTQITDKEIDPDTGNVIVTYNADPGHNAIRCKVGQAKYGDVSVEVINVSAQGRTQILSQDDANAVGGTKVESLELNKANGWKNESKEYSGGSGINVYSYYLVEHEGENYDAQYEVSGDSVVVKNLDTRLRVDKKWFRPDGETELEQTDGEIVYNLDQVTNGREWKEGQFSNDGPYNVDISEFVMGDPNNIGQNQPNVTFGGDTTGIRAGSKVKITITKDNPNNGNMDIQSTSWAPAFNVTGGNVTIGDPYTVNGSDNQAKEKVREIIVEEVSSSIKLKGYMNIQGGNVNINVKVLGEYDKTTGVERQRVGQVTMSYDNATIELDPAFAESDIKIKPDKGHWTSIISGLPESGENGESYTYYVTEESISIEGFEEPGSAVIEPNNVENGSVIVIKNKAKPAKVRVVKAFKGVPNLPDNFKITNSIDDSEFNLNNKAGGSGTESDPYYWEMSNLVIGQKVTFYEWNFGIEGMEMTVTDLDGNEITSPYSVTATAVEEITSSEKETSGVSGFINNYGKREGSLKFKKNVTVNGNSPTADNSSLVDGEYTFTITGPDNDTAVNKTVVIKVESGEATKYKVDSELIFKNLPADKYVIITNLEEGDYTITETGKNGLTLSDIVRGDIKSDSTYEGTSPVSLSESKVIVHVTGGVDEPKDASSSAAVFTNNREFTDFEFSKEWHDESHQVVNTWENGVAITAKVQRKIGANGTSEDVGTYVITKTETGFSITSSENAPDLENIADTFTFKIEELLKNGTIGNASGEYIYFVTEPQKVPGYKEGTYSNPSATTPVEWTTTDQYALNGGKIINTAEEAYELPETGGIGITPFRTAGLVMIVTALFGVFYVKRRERRCDGR